MKDTMTLQEMKTYKGRDEIPADFDEFWNSLLLETSVPDYELTEKDFGLKSVDCYELRFPSPKGSTIYSKCLFPKGVTSCPVVFYFHGYQGKSPDWTEGLKYTAEGMGAVFMDVPGQAGQSRDVGDYSGITVKGQVIRGMLDGPKELFFVDVYRSIVKLIDIVADFEWVDEQQLYSYGASQGGALALIASALSPKITKTASIYPFLSDFKRILELGLTTEPYDEFFRYFKYSDPFHDTEKAVLGTLAYMDVKNFAHRITCPVLFITGLEDDICPPSTQFAIYNRLTTEKSHYILPDYGHDAMHVKVNDLVYDFLTGSCVLTC
ncbi:acetylxylan esterase [Streptococcus sp. S784/96/1]|uniref:acetylxylan esterase n=1 Tax=Streptococcus sp. S784/96/1 TaxID=2653499 RepID=UPI0013866E25|nr:acetylxylan esterase [Streptococcus sp. S784/96/1]